MRTNDGLPGPCSMTPTSDEDEEIAALSRRLLLDQLRWAAAAHERERWALPLAIPTMIWR